MPFYNAINNDRNFSISISSTPRDDFGTFAKGYRIAADIVTEKLMKSKHLSDYEAYPIVFIYRHAFELHLKNIIYQAAKLFAFRRMESIDAKLYNFHDLYTLSDLAQKAMLRGFPKDLELKNLMDDVTLTANEFAQIDPDSYSYRYPINKQGGFSTKPKQIVNLESFANHMSELLEKLEIVDFGLSLETSAAQEFYEAFDNFLVS